MKNCCRSLGGREGKGTERNGKEWVDGGSDGSSFGGRERKPNENIRKEGEGTRQGMEKKGKGRGGTRKKMNENYKKTIFEARRCKEG